MPPTIGFMPPPIIGFMVLMPPIIGFMPPMPRAPIRPVAAVPVLATVLTSAFLVIALVLAAATLLFSFSLAD